MRRVDPDILLFDNGEQIYAQGDIGRVMYVIRSGHVRVVRADSHGEILLATLGPGDFFGEMSLLSGGRRSAGVYAEGIVELDVITRAVFLEHVKDPLARRVLEGVTDRLRKVDSLLEYLHIEQYRVRQDAHDRVYNRLAALSRLVEVAGLEQPGNVHAHDTCDDDAIPLDVIAADIRETVTELQHILGDRSSVDPSPSVGHDTLIARLSGVCESQGDIWHMDVGIHCESDLPMLPQALCWDLECIVEEALNNAAKHGEANWVKVHVDAGPYGSDDAPHVRLLVVDDGRGMARVPDLSELPQRSKGLRGMHSRVQSYGGWLELDSSNGTTRLAATIPVQPS